MVSAWVCRLSEKFTNLLGGRMSVDQFRRVLDPRYRCASAVIFLPRTSIGGQRLTSRHQPDPRWFPHQTL